MVNTIFPLLIICRGKGLKHREIPLVQEAREPLDAYFTHREHLADRWRERAAIQGETIASWSGWPDGYLFLGQRGPLSERGIREIIAKLGQAAKLSSPLGPHDLRHTFAKALLFKMFLLKEELITKIETVPHFKSGSFVCARD